MQNNLSDLNNHLFARSVNGILNHEGLRSVSPEVTETAATLAQLKHKIREIKTETKGD